MESTEKERLIKSDMQSIENRVRHTFNQGYDLGYKTGLGLHKIIKLESVLDKIRAEINGMYRVILKGTPKDDWAVRWNDCLDEVLEIIDKYKIR